MLCRKSETTVLIHLQNRARATHFPFSTFCTKIALNHDMGNRMKSFRCENRIFTFPPLLLTRDGLLCPPRHFADKTSSSPRLTESRTSFSGLHNGPGTWHFQLLIPASTFSQIYMIKFVVSRERDTLAKLLFMIYSRYVMFFLWFQIKFSVT